MTKPTHAECVEPTTFTTMDWLNTHIAITKDQVDNGRGGPLASLALDNLCSIRAKLIAADEMAKVLSEVDHEDSSFTQVNAKRALKQYRATGGQ